MIKNIDKKYHIGTMVFDYADGEYSISNKWIPYQDLSQEGIEEIQKYVNDIMFNRFDSLSKIINYCGGEAYSYEKLFQEETSNYLYTIKLIPVTNTYNGYIYVYQKH